MLASHDYIIFEFHLKYESTPDENIYVLGNHDNFGNWTIPKMKLIWSPGNIWKYSTILPISFDVIEYKFVSIDKHGNKKWEDGPNRTLCTSRLKGLTQLRQRTYLIDCVWNHFTITFNIFYPLKDEFDSLNIVGSAKSLSNWLRDNEEPVKMRLSEKKSLTTKDGDVINGQFWTVTVPMKTDDPNSYNFDYKYSIYNSITKTSIWEKDSRRLNILTELESSTSKALLYKDPQHNVLLMNSHIEIYDVNFVAKMKYHKIGDMNVYIGPYPQNFNDLQELAHKGINTIFNLQTDNDFKQRRIDHHGQLEQCKVLKIDMIRCPIKNYDESDLRDKLCKAAEMLKNILETGKNVYVNCTSGMGRSVSVVVMYLVLFKSYTVDDAVAFVKKYRRVACPNVEAIKEVVNRMKPDTQFGYNDYAACLTIDISKYGY